VQASHETNHAQSLKPIWVVLAAACIVLLISNGARSSWGLLMPEMNQARGWSRETFSLTVAIQNLVWGLSATLFGAMADRFGAMRTIMIGAALYVAGFFGMLVASSGADLALTGGVLVGLGIGGTAFGVVFAAVGKLVSAEQRTMVFGLGTAAGSFGQFLFLPSTAQAINIGGWQGALWFHAGAVALMFLLAFAIRGDREAGAKAAGSSSMSEALKEAMGDRSFHLLFWGYFVCGLQVVFIGLHLPAYLKDQGGVTANMGAAAIAIVGLFNVLGSFASGWIGQRASKKKVLSLIYLARSIVMVLFLALPLSVWSVYLFAAAMGLLWLSTVPLTTGLVGQMYGVRHLGMLGGVVFIGHQVGSFLGAWLGGRIFDLTGSYQFAWWGAIAFGIFAAVMHMPINERPLAQRRLVPAGA
jgi:MFS family permease